jgi:hypothetical protein
LHRQPDPVDQLALDQALLNRASPNRASLGHRGPLPVTTPVVDVEARGCGPWTCPTQTLALTPHAPRTIVRTVGVNENARVARGAPAGREVA